MVEVPTIALTENLVEVPVSLVHEKVVEVPEVQVLEAWKQKNRMLTWTFSVHMSEPESC